MKLIDKHLALTMLGLNASIGLLALIVLGSPTSPVSVSGGRPREQTAMTYIQREMERSSASPESGVRRSNGSTPTLVALGPVPQSASKFSVRMGDGRNPEVRREAVAVSLSASRSESNWTSPVVGAHSQSAADTRGDSNAGADFTSLETQEQTTRRTPADLSQRTIAVPVALQVELPGEAPQNATAATELTEEQAAAVERVRQEFAQEVAPDFPDPSSPEYRRKWQKRQPFADEQLMILLGTELFNKLQIEASQKEYLITGR